MDDRYEDIERYLDGEMPPDESAAFETELTSDDELAQALATVREARARLTAYWNKQESESALQSTLGQLGQTHFELSTSKPSPAFQFKRWHYLAAAAFAALVVYGTVLMLRPQMDDRLYARYRQLPQADFVVRGADAAQAQSLLETAEAAFNRKNYSRALPPLLEALKLQPNLIEAQFFAGLCHLELNQLAEAENQFRTLTAGDNAWAPEAQYYLALTLLRRHDRAGCRTLLQQIDNRNPRYDAAQQLLVKLR